MTDEGSHNNADILIVEDDRTSALMLQRLLVKQGYTVVSSVSSGEDAIEAARKLEPDLVIMDISLSGNIDGIEAADRIYTDLGIPFIYMTSGTDDAAFNRVKKTVPYGYLLKPYNSSMIHAVIELALYKADVELKLSRAERRNEKLLSAIPDIMFTVNPDGSCTDSVDATLARKIWPKQVEKLSVPYLREAVETQENVAFEYALKRGDESRHYEARCIANEGGSLVVIVRNITERKKAEKELEKYQNHLEELVEERTAELQKLNSEMMKEIELRRAAQESQKLFGYAIEQSPNIVVIITEEGIIEYVNNTFRTITGYNEDDICGVSVKEPGNPLIPELELWELLQSKDIWHGEIYSLSKKGELIYMNCSISSLYNDEKKKTHYIMVAEDITGHKKEQLELDRVREMIDRSQAELVDKEMDWKEWKEKMLTRNTSRTDKSLFRNIYNSFTQGAGFGAMLSLIDLMDQSAVHKGDKVTVDSGIYQLLDDNVKTAQDAFKTFSSIDWIISNDFEMEKLSFQEFYDYVKVVKEKAEAFAGIGKHRIIMNELTHGYRQVWLNLNRDYFYNALYEMLINAMKFSRPDTSIIILIYLLKGDVILSIINDPSKTEEGVVGIPPEYEKIIFEPFYRLTKHVFERYRSLDFGLGMTLVEKIVNKHGGEVMARNILDHSDLRREPITKVNITIALPRTRDSN